MLHCPIIFEGLDGSGKTTIAKKMSEKLFKKYYVGNRYDIKDDELLFNVKYAEIELMSTLTELVNLDIIIDRFHISEYVYSHFYNRKIDINILRKCDKKFASVGTVVIFINTSINEILRRGNIEFTENELYDQLKLYKKALSWTSCNILMINPELYNYDVDKVIDNLIWRLKQL